MRALPSYSGISQSNYKNNYGGGARPAELTAKGPGVRNVLRQSEIWKRRQMIH